MKGLPVIGIEIGILPLHIVIEKGAVTELHDMQGTRNQQQDQECQCK
jgi:hypothetical protein